MMITNARFGQYVGSSVEVTCLEVAYSGGLLVRETPGNQNSRSNIPEPRKN